MLKFLLTQKPYQVISEPLVRQLDYIIDTFVFYGGVYIIFKLTSFQFILIPFIY